MPTPQHTPGPWVVFDVVDDDTRAIGITGHENGRNRLIASIEPESFNYGATDDANARLLAVAPDLLETLQALFEMAMSSADKNGLIQFSGNCDAMRDARDAIAKAEGK